MIRLYPLNESLLTSLHEEGGGKEFGVSLLEKSDRPAQKKKKKLILASPRIKLFLYLQHHQIVQRNEISKSSP